MSAKTGYSIFIYILFVCSHVVSDGGCTCPGDFSKAFGAGGDFVMAGGMFAGHEESGGELVEGADGNMYKEFYGECTICPPQYLRLVTVVHQACPLLWR